MVARGRTDKEDRARDDDDGGEVDKTVGDQRSADEENNDRMIRVGREKHWR